MDSLPIAATLGDTVQLETAVNTISHEYLLEFTSEYGIPETLHPELPRPEDRIVDFFEGKVGVYTRVDVIQQKAREEHSSMLHQATGLSQKLEQPLLLGRRESVPDRRGLADECLQRRDAGWEHVLYRGRSGAGYTSYPHSKTTGDATVFSQNKSWILSGGRDMDLFNLFRAPNPTKMDAPAATTDSSGVPSTKERSPLDFAHEVGASDQGTVTPEMPPSEDVPATEAPVAGQAEETAATDPPAAPESRKRGREGSDVNAPPKSLRRDHADPRPSGSSRRGKSLAAIQLGLASTVHVPDDAPAGVRDPKSENASSPVKIGSPESIYRPKWGVANGSLLDTPEACQDLVDHVAPPGYFSELRHMHNEEFLRQYNVNLARHVAMGSQLRLRFEQKAKLLRKSVAQVARRDKRIQARELEIKNLEALLEAEANTKKATEDKSAGLSQELKNMRAWFSDLQQDDRVEQRCAEMKARLDALSIYFDEELYPHMLTAVAGRRWVIGRGLRLAVMIIF
nr:hypothetical protein [Tanacetum cinerariifolium]